MSLSAYMVLVALCAAVFGGWWALAIAILLILL